MSAGIYWTIEILVKTHISTTLVITTHDKPGCIFTDSRDVLFTTLQMHSSDQATVEPLNKGHFGNGSFVHCLEVVPISEVQWYNPKMMF